MKNYFATLTLLTALLMTTLTQADSKPAKIPLKDFFRNPVVARYQISQDGKWLSYMKPWENRLNIFIKPATSHSSNEGEIQVTFVKERDIAGYMWKSSKYILYSRDFGGDENFHVFLYDIKTKKEKDLTPYPKTVAHVINDLEYISEDEVLISDNHRNEKVFDVYRVNLKTGALKLVAENPGNIEDWVIDHQGKVRGATRSDGANSTFLYRDSEKEKFQEVITTTFKDTFSPLFFTFDNKRVYALSNIGRDKISLVEFDPKTKKEICILAQHERYDLAYATYSKKRKTLVAAAYTTWKPQRMFFDTYIEGIYNKLLAKLPNTEIGINSLDEKEEIFIINTYSDRNKGSFYLYNAPKDDLQLLAQVAPWLDETQLAEVKPIEYKSRDGLTIEGYLTLPKGKDPKNLPVVINPHGGPWHRDVWYFNPEAQLLANRGYAVLQMNFRGSTGYGKKFFEASFKQWGKKMQDDVTDGVQWLIDKGIADKKRICIYGGSYGGYATLAGLTFTPDIYACGVDYVGVSNLFTFMETIPPYWETFREKLYAMVGHPEKDKDLLASGSPALHADKIKAPLLVVQGANDPRVKKAESDQIVANLKKRGIDVPYIVKDNEGHGFRNEENRFEFYEAMEKFLNKHIGD
ncbi:MAG: peptidase [Oligoflexia bacterium]|nr:MAG: peptidase [Oligoflexia bacterium]